MLNSNREVAKKVLFFSGPKTKAFTPPPLGLVVIGTFGPKYINIFKKVIFSLVIGPSPPPPVLVVRPLKKELLFAASLMQECMCIVYVCISMRYFIIVGSNG